MTTKKPLSRSEYLAIVVGLGIILAVLLMALLPYGRLQMTYDSQDLVDASKSLHTYLHDKNKDGHSYLVRAPLHPFLLSFFQNKMIAMWWINLVSLVSSLFLVFRISREVDLSVSLAVGVTIITVLFYPWLMNFQFFWTESIFILLILLLAYSLLKDRHILPVTMICLLLFLTRKPGVFFFAATAVFYLTQRRWKQAVTIFITGLVIFTGWQVLEFTYGSTGYFGEMIETLDQYNRVFYLEAMTSWFLPMRIPLTFRTLIILFISIAVFYSFRQKLYAGLRQKQNVVLLSVAGVYSFILITFSGASGYEDAERYLNVVYPLWLIMAFSVVSQIVPSATKIQRILFVSITALWLMYTFLRSVHHLA